MILLTAVKYQFHPSAMNLPKQQPRAGFEEGVFSISSPIQYPTMSFSLFSTPQQQQPQSLFQPQQQQQQNPFQSSPLFSQQQQQQQFLPQQQQQQQPQQQHLFLFTNDRAPANYSTKWADLHPDSQKILLQIECVFFFFFKFLSTLLAIECLGFLCNLGRRIYVYIMSY